MPWYNTIVWTVSNMWQLLSLERSQNVAWYSYRYSTYEIWNLTESIISAFPEIQHVLPRASLPRCSRNANSDCWPFKVCTNVIDLGEARLTIRGHICGEWIHMRVEKARIHMRVGTRSSTGCHQHRNNPVFKIQILVIQFEFFSHFTATLNRSRISIFGSLPNWWLATCYVLTWYWGGKQTAMNGRIMEILQHKHLKCFPDQKPTASGLPSENHLWGFTTS